MMETGKSSVSQVKKPTLTPKAIIYQKFGSKATYRIEEVPESSQNGCPGLAIPQKGPCHFRCYLQLPEISVVSSTFTRKRDAEQSAAEMALQKLGISAEASNSLVLDSADELVARLSYLFSNEFLSSLHPLSSHLKATLRREGELNGLVPVSVMTAYDPKLSNLCTSINPMVDSNPLLAIPYIITAASRLSELVAISDDQLWIRRQNPYPPELRHSLVDPGFHMTENECVEAAYIPSSLDKAVQPIMLNVFSKGYYLDVIAKELGVTDASKVLVSRTIGKASSEMRLYFSALENSFSEFQNARASYLSGQVVYGNAIFATIGYTWKSADLFHEDVSLCSYFRMLAGKTPSGLYKLSREVILAAELPVAFTSRTQWRGSLPRDLLCTFCRQHRLSEPVFSVLSDPLEPVQKSSLPCGPRDSNTGPRNDNVGSAAANSNESVGSERIFRCEIRLFSKGQDLILECSPKQSYKKQNNAVQNAALRVLSWLSMYFREPDVPLMRLNSSGAAVDIKVYHSHFSREFEDLCRLMHSVLKQWDSLGSNFLYLDHANQSSNSCGNEIDRFNIKDPETGETGSYPSNESLVCISCSVSLVTDGDEMKQVLESTDKFEFTIGTGAVIPEIEAALMLMTVGQSACFRIDSLPPELILAAATDSLKILSDLSTKACCLEYSITLLQVTDPLEDRIEQALFSPPLSKQRVEYALQHIKNSSATSLIDFGCGSGSLLDSLIDHPTSLEKIVGVDISQKGLVRAARILHLKLAKSQAIVPSGIKQALLYEGSITVFDSRLHGFDIGTCLEVIEHMEEEQACLFGNIVLSSFCPKILIISTPNYEYNVLLQSSNLSGQEEDPDEKEELPLQSCKFRNHDHKFEWTREQFGHWATALALRHKYGVEFSGVGGSAGVGPGFASQIAVFRKEPQQEPEGDGVMKNVDTTQLHYKQIWEWNAATSAVG
ncbi:hypothetical protein Nepgr_003261 [Nepenthes gracilis]|uniref:Small RNA 2'-O-methyltransferase n=1 Tax=Nepenthes gracilis TaxID=150966 RepID=A0AAD3XDA7_NEPGR|nr:hypothetical protein Nepgr_003261 [Nepenthes gracilis]